MSKPKKKREWRMGRPNPRQLLFLMAVCRWVIFGGARGGGKSWAVRTKAILLCLAYAGIKILIVRRTYQELVANHAKPLKKELNGIAKYNKTEKEFTFENGSTIKLLYCGGDEDLSQYQGQEFDVIFIDEATQMTEYQIKEINVCIRGTNDFPKRMYLTCNPGGKGHQFVKRLVERKFLPEEDPEDYVFIQSLVTDNKALMKAQPEYVKQLKALPPKIREAWLYGRWDIYEGQFFEEFRDDPSHYGDRKYTHVIPAMEEIPRGWKIYRSFDWGYGKPFSCGWWAIDYDGVAYRILELYGCRENSPNEGVKWTDDKIFARIAEIEHTHPYLKGREIHGVADPSCWDTSKFGTSTMDTAARHRVYFDKAQNARIDGWKQMHYRLAFDDNGYPMMYIFDNCKAFIRTIPLLCYDEHNPEDLDTDDEDHVADDARYFCMMRPIKPRMAANHKIPYFDPLDQYKKR